LCEWRFLLLLTSTLLGCQINDYAGHAAGDNALAHSSRIEQSVRELAVPRAGLPITISIGLTQAPWAKPL
jgi:hypothetical protein